MNRAIAWFASNHVAANLLMLFFMVAGIITLFSMKIEVFPETDLDKVSITVEYPGASPAEVEESVIRRIEEQVAGVTGIKRIDSSASEGMARITVEVQPGFQLRRVLDDVKSEVDRLTTLPDEAEKAVVREVVRRSQVLWLSVYGDAPESTLKHLAERIQDDITNLPGITSADLFGVRKAEIHIEVSEDTLRKYNLTLEKLAQAAKRASLDLPAGRIKTKTAEILVRAKGRRYHARDYANIPVLTNPDGTVLTLGQIATIKEGFQDSDIFARYQGKPAALVQIFRVADQNALDVADIAKQYMKRMESELPQGVKMGVFGDRSLILKSRMNLLLRNLLMGLCLVAILLTVFLQWRLAFWVAFGIAVAFSIGAFILPFVGVSINMISLFGFILVLGIVVDDAIVVGENIFKKREQGVPRLKAAIEGAQEVGGPVIFSVLTTMAAFAPLLMGTGSMGKVMRNIPWVVILVLFGSLLESLYVLPAHLARSRMADPSKGKPRKKRGKSVAKLLQAFTYGPYLKFLRTCLTWRYATLAAGICLLLLTVGVFTGGVLKFTLFPKVESDIITAQVTMASGTPVGRTTQVAANLEDNAAKAFGEVDRKRNKDKDSESLLQYTVSLIGVQAGRRGPHGSGGDSGGHVATVFSQLLDGEKRDVRAMELAGLWRKRTGTVPDAESITFQSELFSAGSAVEVHLSAPNEAELMQAVAELKDYLHTLPGVFDVSDSFVEGKDELRIDLKPTGRALGLTLGELSSQVRHAFYGAEALRLQRDKDEVKVLVRYPEAERHSLDDIERMRIRTPGGHEVPFKQVAEVSMHTGYSTIERAQRRRVIKVTADVDEQVTNAAEIRKNLTKNILPDMKARYQGLRFDLEGEGREERESFADIQQGFLIALMGIYILLAIPFKSFTQPFVVMAAIPFGVVGAIAGHLLLGYNLSLLSLFGIVGLSGVVVNDSLLLIHTANRLREERESVFEAIAHAGCLRMRPILLTSITTFAGLMPIIMERSLQAQFLIPMAISLGFGVIFATGITLVLIPCGYMILDDIQRLISRIGKGMGRVFSRAGV